MFAHFWEAEDHAWFWGGFLTIPLIFQSFTKEVKLVTEYLLPWHFWNLELTSVMDCSAFLTESIEAFKSVNSNLQEANNLLIDQSWQLK